MKPNFITLHGHGLGSTVAILLLILRGSCCGATADWPVYRHDITLSGVSHGKGKINTPELKWEYYLGTPFTELAANKVNEPQNIVDLDGDGVPETFAIHDKKISVSDQAGHELWSFTVDGFPLGAAHVVKLFPKSKGQQILCFSSRMDTGEGQGYCFSFEKGARHGELAWTTGPLSAQYSPMLVVDDVDGDGLPDIVNAPHYRVQIFNGQTGKLQTEVTEAKGRNYGMLLTRPRKNARQKDIYVISDFVLHVECVRFENGKWVHAWGYKYLEDENAARPRGRENYIRVGPNPVADLDGDGQDEMVYMIIDAAKDDRWHLIVRDCETGKARADLADIWLWSVADLNGDSKAKIIYTPTREKRPATYCDVHVAHLEGGKLKDTAMLKRVRPVMMNATLPPTASTIADEGTLDILQADVDGDGKPELFFGEQSGSKSFEDTFEAVSLTIDGKIEGKWRFSQRGHRMNMLYANTNAVRLMDLSSQQRLEVDVHGKIIQRAELGRPGGFTTMPIVADLDGDGRNEIVVQNAAREIVAMRFEKSRGDAPEILWSLPGVAMNRSPGYAWNGALCPQAGDLDGDGRPEILFAAEGKSGMCELVCVNGRGKIKWRRAIEGCPWGGMQAGIDHWTFGHFTGRPRGLDVYVDLHRRSKGSGEGWVLRGDTGEVVWRQSGIVAKESAMPFGGGIPSVTDMNGDGIDDLIAMFYTVYGVSSGKTGEPIYPPAFVTSPKFFGKWLAYSQPTVADLNGDGKLEVYLNSNTYARGGYAAVHADGTPLWAEFHKNDEGSDGLGPVGDFDGDGKIEIGVPVVNGTLLCLNGSDGSHKWSIKTPVTGDVIAADVNGDGIMELLFAGHDGKLHAVSGKDGHEVWAIAGSGQPIVADVDGDGLVEVLAVGHDGVLRVNGAK